MTCQSKCLTQFVGEVSFYHRINVTKMLPFCFVWLQKIHFEESKKPWPADWKWHEHITCIRDLFNVLNEKLFWNKLDPSVVIILSPDLTWDGGVFVPASAKEKKPHEIFLSAPLLSLRTKHNFIGIFVHECIHFYLYVTKKDINGSHENEFVKQMRRINKKTGLEITVGFSILIFQF